MPVKIRLQRHGKKGKPYFWIVASDSRNKRDGRFLEKLGFYNPTTNPAQIDLNVDGAVKWLQNGAQPTDTARAILSYKGALMKNHLAGGVRKGALTEEQAETKFNEWIEQKSGSIDHKKATVAGAKDKAKAEAFAAEKAVNEKRAADAHVADAPVEAETEVENTPEETATEATETAEVTETAAEDVVEDSAKEESPSAEATVDETPAETATEEVVEDTAKEEETPSAEATEAEEKKEE